jgi:hypothetical protein
MWNYDDLNDYAAASSQDRLRPMAVAAVHKVARLVATRLELPNDRLAITDWLLDYKSEPAEEGSAASFWLTFETYKAMVYVTCIEHGGQEAEPSHLELRFRAHSDQDLAPQIVRIKDGFSEAEEEKVAATFSAAVRSAIRAWA